MAIAAPPNAEGRPLLLSFHKVAGTFGKSHCAIMGIIPVIQVSLERKREDDGGERGKTKVDRWGHPFL